MVPDPISLVTADQRLTMPGRIARALAVFSVDEVIIFDDSPPASEELLKVPGVVSVDALPSGLLRVSYSEGQTPAESLVQAAVNNGWGLHQIGPDQTSLEDVFVQLTYQEQAA